MPRQAPLWPWPCALCLCAIAALGGLASAQEAAHFVVQNGHLLHHASYDAAVAARRKEAHNPLELFKVHNLQFDLQQGAKIWTTSKALNKSGTWFDVYWSGLVSPKTDDLIALYVPADADPRQTAPAKFMWANRAPAHMARGAGHLRFRVLNMRQGFKFSLLRNGLQSPKVAAMSEPISNMMPNEPTQGHLSLTGRPGEVVVQWVTRDVGNSQVLWGMEPGHYTHAAPAHSITYTRQELCGPPARNEGWAEPGILHAAVMTGLEPRTRYYYRYGDEDFGWSKEASFRSPPPAGRDITVKVLAVADLGQAEVDGSNEVAEIASNSLKTTTLMSSEPLDEYDLLVHNGDVSYARGYFSQWENFFHQLHPLASRLPYMTCPGNHERDWPSSGDRFPEQYDSGGECGIPYHRHTRMPTASEDEPWYSFDLGPIHFLQYSTEHEFEPGSQQHTFIEMDLKSVDRTKTPWVVVGGHRPIYVDSTWGVPPDGDQFVAGQLRASLEKLFYRYAVDVTWHGHHHSYQRTCPVLAGRCMDPAGDGVAGAPVHIVIGHAGADLSPNAEHETPGHFVVVKFEYGYLRVTANATHMEHQVVSSGSGLLMDEFTLRKPPTWAFSPRTQQAWEEASTSGVSVSEELVVGGLPSFLRDADALASS